MNIRPVFVNTPAACVTRGVTQGVTQINAVNAPPCAMNADAPEAFANRRPVNSGPVFVNTRLVFVNTSTANTPDGRPLTGANTPTAARLLGALRRGLPPPSGRPTRPDGRPREHLD